MYIQQKQLENLRKLASKGKVILIYGPRRCGKTTLISQYIKEINSKFLLVNGEDILVHNYLSSRSIQKLKDFIGDNKILIIDEAQKIQEIGSNLKLIIDHIPDISIIATGSSSFDLARFTGEPLTGRKFTLKLFPLSQLELSVIEQNIETKQNLEKRLIYGSYPEVLLKDEYSEKERYLREIISSYLYKDILEMDGIRHSDKIVKILQLLAFQIGKDVSLNEIGSQLGISKNTVERYLDLLEKSFVTFRLSAFNRNLRKEISKSPRFFFYDNGVRNALINNFNPLNLRDDVGMLWENYIIIERIKKQEYSELWANNYFWRTYDKKEIDFIEERQGSLNGYEVKWGLSQMTKIKVPKDWQKNYPNSTYTVINRDNYLAFIT
jgi:uncharacterized protein